MKIIKESKIIKEDKYVVDDVGIRAGTLRNEEIEGIVYGHDEENEYINAIKFKLKKKPMDIEIVYINSIFTEEEKEEIKEILKDNIKTNYSELLKESKIKGNSMKIIKESKKLNEAKTLADKVADELEKVGLTAYAGGAYLGHMVQIETEEEKNKAKKVADKFGLETKERPHKEYTDFYILIPEEEEKKPVTQKRKTRKKIKESLKRINEDVTITNSPYKDEIAKYFGYSGDFEFLDLVADILSSIDDFTDDEDINYEIDNNLSYYSEAWKVFEHYCWTNINEDPKYYDDAYIPFVDDIFALCSIISNKDTEEIEESCKKPVKESVLSEKGKQALKNRR